MSEACWAAEWTRLGAIDLCDQMGMAVGRRRSARCWERQRQSPQVVVPLTLAHRSRVPAKAHFAAEKEKGRKLVEASGLICGAGATLTILALTRMNAHSLLCAGRMCPHLCPQPFLVPP